ncbi:efflux RND transporter permease subunit [Thauera linaloolentis]|uniref:RND efflux transporter n=1 Tax=Thauera linaloolentis (strain DSM 12138 / JCM 21573 / CCUG 41526 / CIP 105981 / IAM 15112 / NBRC 102519 / 47Lol) TaxID=1123367 RepID=N6Z073_THAL4|nr:MMPL family transporter [Thauera linaloolentis]ENO85574.1 RND efflux transporter [Thauera linaloolentis 47Lol = DSM 12138]MCM8566530.1 MMPL family transporter [Thauera linaloolentis]
MAVAPNKMDMAIIRDPKDFDSKSGGKLEQIIFNNRLVLILVCVLLTLFLGFQMKDLKIGASYDKMLPQSHPYIQNYLENRVELRGLGDSLRIVVAAREGDIFDAGYLETLARINDEVFLLPGVDRPWMKSIFTPVVRWTEVTEEGFAGGPVLPNDYDGSPRSIEDLRINIARANVVGSLVANDYRSSMIVVPLLPLDADGNAVDYHALSKQVDDIRERYAGAADAKVDIYVIGFAKLIGDLISGLEKVALFFLIAVVIAVAIIYTYTRCIRSTVLVLSCSIVAVVWQLGLVSMLGYGLDPFSMLVPFLVVAIGVSHGAQKMNGIMQDIGRGTHRLVAARYTFRRLFLAGMTALLADVVGFAVLMIIDIPVIRELALTASIGVGVLIFTNLILIPVMLSYIGVSPKAAARALAAEHAAERAPRGFGRVWALLERFTERRWAVPALLVSAVLGVWGFMTALQLQIGDLDAGAPELRADSRYNQDNAFITGHYGISSDVFAVIVKTPDDGCRDYETLTEIDLLDATLAQVPGVQRTASLGQTVRTYTAGMFEGNPKWATISDNQSLIDPQIGNAVSWNSEFLNARCSVSPVLAYLSDHKAGTLEGVVEAARAFSEQYSTPERQYLLAAGNAGVDATTNIVVKEANRQMLLYVYAAVAVLCLITFRSWRAVVVALLPLILTSILAEALMVHLGIGVKVATLPVVALGVGIGIDYAIYLLSIQLVFQRAGMSVADAYKKAVATTGKVVALVGVTLAAGVVTWVWSPIKFQADMGILLTFMFVWNMLGALILVPALSYFLLQGESRGRGSEAAAPRAQERQAAQAV